MSSTNLCDPLQKKIKWLHKTQLRYTYDNEWKFADYLLRARALGFTGTNPNQVDGEMKSEN